MIFYIRDSGGQTIWKIEVKILNKKMNTTFPTLSDEDAKWVENNPEHARRLAAFAIRERKIIHLNPWKTIEAGSALPAVLDREYLRHMDNFVAEYVQSRKWDRAPILEAVDLVTLTSSELGLQIPQLPNDLLSDKFCADWSLKHLDGQAIELCKPEDGLHLCRQFRNQGRGGRGIFMATQPDTYYRSCLLNLVNLDGSHWLLMEHRSDPKRAIPLDMRLVFRLKRTISIVQ